jgi:hypothetical protein
MRRAVTHHWYRGLVGTVVVASSLALACAAVANASRTAPTGPAPTVSYYVRTSDNFNKLTFLDTTYSGDYWLLYETNGSWRFWWDDKNKPAAGAIAVSGAEVTAMSHGKQVWATYVWTATCAAGHICFSTLTPLEFSFDQTRDYYAELTGTHDTPGCWTPSTVSWFKGWNSYGAPLWYPGTSTSFATASNFRPMVKVGQTVTVTSTYSYTGDKAKVTEIDTIDATTDLFTKSQLQVGKGDASYDGPYVENAVYSVPKATPKAPKLHDYCA